MTTIQSKKKINIICTFVLLSFSLLFNVSYAEFGTTGRSISKVAVSKATTDVDHQITENYSMHDIFSIVRGYSKGNTSETIYKAMCSDLESNGFAFVYSHGVSYSPLMVYPYETVDIGYAEDKKTIYTIGKTSETQYVYVRSGTGDPGYQAKWVTNNASSTYACYYEHAYSAAPTLYTHDIKTLTISSSKLYWDGESYFYKVPEEENPILPTNAEITQAVQSFYDSDYYKNNKDFKDFIVLYDNSTQLYSFIGHTVSDWLMQVIVPPEYRYKNHIFDVQWWMFEINENSGAPAYSSKYYLYSTDPTAETIIYNGVDSISNLVNNPWSVSNTIIVYSTHDYIVRTYVKDENTGEYAYTDGAIKGDQYTYDENLDITDNQYNPLDKFVTVNPSQTIIDGADFSSLSNSFEEHKGLFSFTENMQWLVVANNKLSNYFLGFIVMCALFITLSRVMKG